MELLERAPQNCKWKASGKFFTTEFPLKAKMSPCGMQQHDDVTSDDIITTSMCKLLPEGSYPPPPRRWQPGKVWQP